MYCFVFGINTGKLNILLVFSSWKERKFFLKNRNTLQSKKPSKTEIFIDGSAMINSDLFYFLFLCTICRAALKGATSIVSSSSSTSGLSPLEVGTTPVVSDPNRNPKPAPPQRGKKKATAPNPLSRMQRSDDSSKAKKKKARKFLR